MLSDLIAGRGRTQRPRRHGALPLPHQGARRRPAEPHRPARAARGAPGDLRRRHPHRRAALDPRPRQPRADQPRPAPPLAAARPRAVELVPAGAALRRRRRVPRLQGRLRRPHGGGAATAATGGRALPLRADLRLRVRHRGRPGGARLPAPRYAGHPGHAGRLAPRVDDVRPLGAAAARRRDRAAVARQHHHRDGRAARRVRARARADRGLRAVAGRGRGRGARSRRSGSPSRTSTGSPPTAAATCPRSDATLERSLRAKELLGLAATNALELGVDVSGLDAVLLAGWPGTLSSLWQQAGRAGRSGERSLAVLVAADDPLDTFVVHHPEAIFGRGIEATVVDPDNPHVLAPHLAAAAAELPVTEADLEIFGPQTRVAARRARRPRHPQEAAARLVLGARGPARRPPLAARGRRARAHHRDPHRPRRRHRRRLERALPGAHRRRAPAPGPDVGRHRARPRRPRGLRRARRPRLDDAGAVGQRLPDRPRDRARGVGAAALLVRPRHGAPPGRPRSCAACPAARCSASTRSTCRRARSRRRRCGGRCPSRSLAAAGVAEDGIPGAAHAAEHAAIGMLPLFATADRWDIGGVSTALHPDTGLPTILIYDGHPGGAGFAERGYRRIRPWLSATRDAIALVRVPGGLPVVHPVAQVRQRQRAPRQARRRGAARPRPASRRSRSREPDVNRPPRRPDARRVRRAHRVRPAHRARRVRRARPGSSRSPSAPVAWADHGRDDR